MKINRRILFLLHKKLWVILNCYRELREFARLYRTTQADMDKLKIQYLNDLAEGKVDHAQLQREQKLKDEENKKKSKSNGPGVH